MKNKVAWFEIPASDFQKAKKFYETVFDWKIDLWGDEGAMATTTAVDKDQNPQTGYVINDIGAEALFENHTWNIYNGSGNDWNWAPTELLIHFEDTGSHVSWNISRSLLRSSGLDIVFQLVDSNWDAVFVTDKITYTLK